MAILKTDVDLGVRYKLVEYGKANDEPGLDAGERMIFVCNCGGRLFELQSHGAVCIKCLAVAEGW